MAREKTDYRDNLELLRAHFGAALIPIKDAARYCGLDERTLRASDIDVKKVGRMYYVPVVALARWLSC